MIHAYQETYLSNAQTHLGEAFDYAINICNISGESFIKLFTVSKVSKRFETGEAKIISGKSGVELAMDIIFETTGSICVSESYERFWRSTEYWIGWAIAYYQWYSNRSFDEIFTVISFDDLTKMYPTLHEADISKFVDIVDVRIKKHFTDTNLKHIRSLRGCSQSELAKLSGVGLRSIQMYEQRHKDINKANAETLLKLSKVLGCTMEDLIEK